MHNIHSEGITKQKAYQNLFIFLLLVHSSFNFLIFNDFYKTFFFFSH